MQNGRNTLAADAQQKQEYFSLFREVWQVSGFSRLVRYIIFNRSDYVSADWTDIC